MCIYIYIYIYICVCVCVYIYIHTHTHTCFSSRLRTRWYTARRVMTPVMYSVYSVDSFTKSLHGILKLIYFRRHSITWLSSVVLIYWKSTLYSEVKTNPVSWYNTTRNIPSSSQPAWKYIWTVMSTPCTAADVTSWDPRSVLTNVTIVYILNVLTATTTELRQVLLYCRQHILRLFVIIMAINQRDNLKPTHSTHSRTWTHYSLDSTF